MHDPTAIDLDRLAGDEGGGIAGQEEDHVCQLFRRAAAFQRLVFQDEPVVALRVRVDLLGVSREGAGRDTVHRDVSRAKLPGHGASHRDGGTLGGDVAAQAIPPAPERDAGDIHHPAAPTAVELRETMFDTQEIAALVYGNYPVELFR